MGICILNFYDKNYINCCAGGKKKPLKQPKAADKDYDEVNQSFWAANFTPCHICSDPEKHFYLFTYIYFSARPGAHPQDEGGRTP